MEDNNEGLEDDFHLQMGDVQVPLIIFWGVLSGFFNRGYLNISLVMQPTIEAYSVGSFTVASLPLKYFGEVVVEPTI